MRRATAVALFLLALAVPPNHSVKIFLQKFQPLKNYVHHNVALGIQKNYKNVNVTTTTSTQPPRQRNFTWSRSSDVGRALKVIGIADSFNNLPAKKSSRMPAQENKRINFKIVVPDDFNSGEQTNQPTKKIIGARTNENTRVSAKKKNVVPLQTAQTKGFMWNFPYKYEQPTETNTKLKSKSAKLTTQTSKHTAKLDQTYNARKFAIQPNEISAKAGFGPLTNSLQVSSANRLESTNYTLPPNPPRLLESIGDVFGLNVQNTWNGIKNIFSMYFNEDYINSVKSALTSSTLEDAHLDITRLAKKNGYDVEEHRVKTSDGYILTMHRLLDKQNVKTKARPVVFLMHGLVDSADSWVLLGRGQALAYLLVDEGFDVWMGNARGNKYSLKHSTLSSKQSEFWKFTWEEIGLYDLPAMIDYTLSFTDKDKLHYVGHSQGTTCFFVLTSTRPEYNANFETMFALSPVAYMNHIKSPVVKLFSPAHELLSYWFSNLNVYAPITDSFNRIMELFCYLLPRCDNLVTMLMGGGSYGHINQTLLPAIFAHMPTGSSTLQVMHYAQLTESGKFCRYDYGQDINLEVYGRVAPPDYELGNIEVPIVLYYSDSDWLAAPQDVRTLKKKLTSTVVAEIFIQDFNHLDFMYAGTAKDVIYENVIKLIKKEWL